MQFVSRLAGSDTVWAKVKQHDENEFHASNENPDRTIWRCSTWLSVFQLARNKTDGPDMIWIMLP